MNETKPIQETEFVFRRLADALRVFGKEVNPHLWLAVLIPVLLAAAVYVVVMYVRDSRSAGGGWATFLGVLRCAVYGLLAWAFLLPAWQTWETTETRSQVMLVIDVSGSMATKDDLPSEAMPVEKLLTRQDKVVRFLTSDFLKRLQVDDQHRPKNPVTAYRFGGRLDPEFKVFEGGRVWSADEWNAWLKPDPHEEVPADLTDDERAEIARRLARTDVPADERAHLRKRLELAGLDEAQKARLRDRAGLQAVLVNGTNLGEAVLAALGAERGKMLQGVIVISDGRSTQFNAQTFADIQAQSARDKVPVFTVGVGDYRQPVNIRITDLLAPEQTRPEDRFPVRVEVDGEGLPDREVAVTLQMYRPGVDPRSGKPSHEVTASGRFGREGTPPHTQVEFPIEAALLPPELRKTEGAARPELEEGEWHFRATVPRDPHEPFVGKVHASEAEKVTVIKKPLRVLLFAGGPTKDYQFLRAQLVREVDHKRAELSICLQGALEGAMQDVEKGRLLKRFPGSLRSLGETGEERYDNLNEYDLVIAIDPDWRELPPEHLANLERWVEAGGGLLVEAGPIYTFELARTQNAERLRPLLNLLPVVLDDSRSLSLGPAERPTTEPWRLNFPGATDEMEFLKLEEGKNEALAGWEEFFTGRSRGEGAAGEATVRRGFFNYYPVRDKKPGATVVATFADPRARLSDGREMPYLVSTQYRRGRVLYLGWGEMWRLRQYREEFFERFATKAARYAAAGALGAQRNPSNVYVSREYPANSYVRPEAHLLGADLQPVPQSERPKLKVRRLRPPPGAALRDVDLRPKSGQPNAWDGWFAGRFLATEPGDYEVALTVPGSNDTLTRKFSVKEANPEMDNTQPDFAQLRQLASPAADVLARVRKEDRGRVEAELDRTNRIQEAAADKNAEDRQERTRLFFDLKGAEVIPDCMITDVRSQKSRGAVEDVWDDGVTVNWGGTPYRLSYLLIAAVVLLSVEWLTRKLLKLA